MHGRAAPGGPQAPQNGLVVSNKRDARVTREPQSALVELWPVVYHGRPWQIFRMVPRLLGQPPLRA
jgi:hypothetical protein